MNREQAAGHTKLALVTGGSRGIGRSGALNLAQSGVDVILTYRQDVPAAEAVVAEIEDMGARAAALPLDQADPSSINAFADALRSLVRERWKRTSIDYLVNNAGAHCRGRLGEIAEVDFDFLCNTHLKSVLFLTQELLPTIADGGRILNVSSALTRFITPGSTNSIVYASMKGAVEVMTRYMAQELAPRAISVNVLAPGATATDFGGGTVRDNPEIREVVAAHTAFGRAGTPEDIGPIIASLLSDPHKWVTGQRIEASGGMFL